MSEFGIESDETSEKKVAKLLTEFGFYRDEAEIDESVLLEILDKDFDGIFSK